MHKRECLAHSLSLIAGAEGGGMWLPHCDRGRGKSPAMGNKRVRSCNNYIHSTPSVHDSPNSSSSSSLFSFHCTRRGCYGRGWHRGRNGVRWASFRSAVTLWGEGVVLLWCSVFSLFLVWRGTTGTTWQPATAAAAAAATTAKTSHGKVACSPPIPLAPICHPLPASSPLPFLKIDSWLVSRLLCRGAWHSRRAHPGSTQASLPR